MNRRRLAVLGLGLGVVVGVAGEGGGAVSSGLAPPLGVYIYIFF